MEHIQNVIKGSQVNQPEPQAQMTAEQELVYRLKSAIDNRGRYSYRLNDMAAGYAAGKGITTLAARREIELKFSRRTGQTPQKYLDRHYEQLKQQQTEQSRSR